MELALCFRPGRPAGHVLSRLGAARGRQAAGEAGYEGRCLYAVWAAWRAPADGCADAGPEGRRGAGPGARGVPQRIGLGGFAEYVCVPETALAPLPAGLTYEQAAALPQAGPSRCRASGTRDRSGPGR